MCCQVSSRRAVRGRTRGAMPSQSSLMAGAQAIVDVALIRNEMKRIDQTDRSASANLKYLRRCARFAWPGGSPRAARRRHGATARAGGARRSSPSFRARGARIPWSFSSERPRPPSAARPRAVSRSDFTRASGCGTRSANPSRSSNADRHASACSDRWRATRRGAMLASPTRASAARTLNWVTRRPDGRSASSYSCVTARVAMRRLLHTHG